MKKLVWSGDVDDELVGKIWKGGWSKLILCSEGGDVYCARAVCDYLLQAPKPVLLVGKAFSAATAVAACGDPCEAAPGTRLMVHEPSACDVGGNRAAVEKEAKELRVWLDWYLDLLTDRTGTPRETWEDLVTAETYLSAAAARDLGLVDRILAG